MNPILLSILTTTGATVLADLVGYARIRQQHNGVGTSPPFDWTLFAVRVAIGVISGALAGAGIQATSPAA